MNIFLVFCASLIIFPTLKGQIRYACRIRNFTIESETGSIYLIDMKINQHENEHTIVATVNITKDFYTKNVEVLLDRCSFEKFDCEYFQRWKFTERLKTIVYMKNQMWTPIFDHITPKLDIPRIKKNIYRTPNMNLDPKAIVMFYPEAVNYFWRAYVIVSDNEDRKPFIMTIEFAIFTFVERNRKKDRGGARKSNTTRKTK